MSGRKRITYLFLSIFMGAIMFLVFRPFAFAIAIAALVTGVVVGLIILIRWSRYRLRRFNMRNTIEGIIEEKTEIINARIQDISEKIQSIDKELSDLELQSTSAEIQDEVDRLKEEFGGEKELLLGKLAFYNLTKEKYAQMLDDRQHIKTIKEKQRHLDQTRGLSQVSDDDDDRLELDKLTIEELDFLKLKMEEASNPERAEEIISEARRI